MAFEYGRRQIGEEELQRKNSGVYSQTLFGQNVLENPVPVWTADQARRPYVAFQDPGTGKRIGINRHMLSLGLLAMGVPGSGKTNFFNMNLSGLLATMGERDVIVIFDTKGDYLSEFSGRIAGEERIVIGAGEEYRGITGYHNLFAEIMPRGGDGKLLYSADCDTDALDISEQLFSGMKSETQPVFPAMAEQIFAAVLIYFMRTFWRSDQAKLNNRELLRFFTHSTNDDLRAVFQLDYMRDQRSCVDYIAGRSNQTQGVNSYIGSMIKKMFVGPFAEADPSREFSMREVMEGNGRKIVFIEYDLRRGNVMAPMYGILIDRALANALGGRQGIRKDACFLLDEMLLLPPLQHLSNSLNFGRSQGVKMLCGLQNTAGMEDLYGDFGARNMLSSFQNMVVFRLNDHDTRQFVIRRMGENYSNHSISPQQKNLNIQREGHTVEDWQLMSLRPGEAVVALAGESPFLFTMPKYQSTPDNPFLSDDQSPSDDQFPGGDSRE